MKKAQMQYILQKGLSMGWKMGFEPSTLGLANYLIINFN